MSKRKQLDRERLEITLLNLILASGPVLRVSGFVFLVYGLVMISISPDASLAMVGLAITLLLPGYCYTAALYWARIGAWVGVLLNRDE